MLPHHKLNISCHQEKQQNKKCVSTDKFYVNHEGFKRMYIWHNPDHEGDRQIQEEACNQPRSVLINFCLYDFSDVNLAICWDKIGFKPDGLDFCNYLSGSYLCDVMCHDGFLG